MNKSTCDDCALPLRRCRCCQHLNLEDDRSCRGCGLDGARVFKALGQGLRDALEELADTVSGAYAGPLHRARFLIDGWDARLNANAIL